MGLPSAPKPRAPRHGHSSSARLHLKPYVVRSWVPGLFFPVVLERSVAYLAVLLYPNEQATAKRSLKSPALPISQGCRSVVSGENPGSRGSLISLCPPIPRKRRFARGSLLTFPSIPSTLFSVVGSLGLLILFACV
jgi:hypothetical protein